MNKDLEALKTITQTNVAIDESVHVEAVRVIEQALTPPTRNEVCKALSDYYKFKVDYCDKAFFLTSGFTNVKFCVYEENGRVFINDSYAVPPHLITMIGKFYESVEGEK